MALTQLAQRRITKLADFMESLPEEAAQHFDMETWFRHGGENHDHGLKRGCEITSKHLSLCGTTACALGWAATVPAFRKAGLAMKFRENSSGVSVVYKGKNETHYQVFEIATEFFDIDHGEALYLFRDVLARTPKQWARKARAFLKRQRSSV